MKEQNGKRLLAWVLSAMLLLSNLPFAFAQGLGEGHPEEATPGEGLEAIADDKVTPCPDGEHVFVDGVCTKCSMEEPKSAPERCPEGEHAFVDGVCTKCSMEEPKSAPERCPEGEHVFADGVCTKCSMEEPQSAPERCPDGEHAFVDGVCTKCSMEEPQSAPESCAKGEHDFVDGICTVCGTVCEHVFEAGVCAVCRTACEHVFEDGVCTVCGVSEEEIDYAVSAMSLEEECAHENAPYGYIWYEGYPTSNENGTHTGICDVMLWECPDCGATDEVLETNVLKTEDCNFDTEDGRCADCGAEGPRLTCDHSDLTKRSYYWLADETADPNQTTFVDNGDGTHTRRSIARKSWICLVCGYQNWTLDENAERRTNIYVSDHELDSEGRCIYCDYVKSEDDVCKHPQTIQVATRVKVSSAPHDENGHIAKYQTSLSFRCADCGTQVGSGGINDEEVVEPHDFGSDGECYECGYVNHCQHAATSTMYYWSESKSTEKVDETGHRVVRDRIEYVTCLDCGAWLSDKVVEENVAALVPHNIWQGLCRECGYVKPCDHLQTQVERTFEALGESQDPNSSVFAYTPLDEEQHTGVVRVKETTVCADCGQVLKRAYEPAQKIVCEHSFYRPNNTTWQCSQCGYTKKNDCKHTNTAIEKSPEEDGCEAIKAEADGHLVTTKMVIREYCKDCGITIKQTVSDKSEQVFMPHSMENGKCFVCGYESACKHDGLIAESEFYDLVHDVKDNENGTHTMIADVTMETWCELCGECLSEEIKRNQTVTEAHEFASGECIYCHSANPCKHEGTTYVYTGYVNCHDVKDNGDGTHTMTCDVIKTTRCDVCDDALDQSTEYNQTVTEEHDFEMGGGDECYFCHAKKTTPAPEITPAPTSAPTSEPTSAPDADSGSSSGSNSSSGSSSGASSSGNAISATAVPADETETETVIAGEMVKALQLFVLTESVQDADAVIESVGAEEILSASEYATFKQLSMNEQIYVMLITAGLGDAVNASLAAQNVTLSSETQALTEAITARMDALEGDEKQAMLDLLAKYFPIERIVVDGVTCDCITLTFEVTANGQTHTAMFRFYYDESRGEWVTFGA